MITVSDPQRLTINPVTVTGFSHYLTTKGLDAHEFAKEYVDRTEALGYPPSLAQSIHQFMSERGVAI